MYQVGHRPKELHAVRNTVLFVLLVLAAGGWMIAPKFLKAETSVSQSMPKTTYVDAGIPANQEVSGPNFSVKVPASWVPAKEVVPNARSWQGGTRANAARRLDVYVDTVPTAMAVNRLMPVKAEGSGLQAVGNVSDSCINFTDKTTTSAQGVAPSKWAGITFLCDTANTLRNLVGTGSSDVGSNITNVVDASGKTHQVFLVYTDHTSQPDYTIFEAIIRSFSLK